MKNIFLTALAASVLLTSCEQVIDYELDEAAAKVVFEGLITDEPGPYIIKISQTRGYLDQEPNQGILGAVVVVQDNQGNIDTLEAAGPGIYRTRTLQGVIGNTYQMRAFINGQEYSAQSTMRDINPVDSVSFEFKEETSVQDEGYYPTFYFQEKAGKGDYYKIDFYKNGQRLDDVIAINDDLYDGNYGDPEVGHVLQLADTFRVEMYSLDKPAYDFWLGMSTLYYQGGSPFETPPANPPSNISNGALGFFGASAKRTATRVAGQ